jgi:glycosyltransferase involved in cell wall biosynthesis
MNISIIIPCYNEEKYIYRTLENLTHQLGVSGAEIIIADGNSTDNTLEEVYRATEDFPFLNIRVTKGGKVSYGRNQGAKIASNDYLLFLDADTVLMHNRILWDSYNTRLTYDIISCKHVSTEDRLISKILWKTFNWIRTVMPETFCTGCYFFISKKKFFQLGMFDETVTNSEDYLLSRKVPKSRFLVLDWFVGQDDRRFNKIGYWGFLKIVVLNYIYRNNINYFRKDVGYWG